MQTHQSETHIVNSAPGHYETEKVRFDHSPKYTFGVKTVEKVTHDSPGKCLQSILILKDLTAGVKNIR